MESQLSFEKKNLHGVLVSFQSGDTVMIEKPISVHDAGDRYLINAEPEPGMSVTVVAERSNLNHIEIGYKKSG